MNKEQFNQLEPLEQIQYINDNIGLVSLNLFCQRLGVSRTTITDRFTKLGYKYNKQAKQFQLVEQEEPTGELIQEPQSRNINTVDIMSMLHRITELEHRVEKLESKATQDNSYTISPMNSNIRFYPKHQDTTYTMRINIDVFNKFKEFANKNSQYKQRDLISSALELYMELFDK